MLGLAQIFGKETVAGVDIGSRWIKVVQAEAQGPGRWRIGKAGLAPTPENAVHDGVVVEPAAVGSAIRELMKASSIEANGAAAAISGASVIVRHVKMPRMAEAVLRKSVRFEAAKYISTSVEDSLIEFEITGPVPGEDDKMGVMLVAAPQDMVESRLAALSHAGLTPVAVDVEAFALQRALLDLSATRPGEGATLALLDIGAASTDVNIVTDGRFALTRNIDYAGDHFTKALQALHPQADRAQLEQIKREVDMSALLSPDAGLEAQSLARAVQPVMDELLREVRRSINYYQSQLMDPANSNLPAGVTAETGGGTVSRIVVTGGSARMAGLEAYMAARLGLPVEAWNVCDNPAFDMTALAPSFLSENAALLTTGMGLALKELTEAPAAKGRRAKAA
ncbi:MAG: type IV pilus assembly protein PilM [Armatimonadetes bacterium]|nr:type IV pilus assembly protein PilM [Armatimonadota bacterium]